MNSPEPGLYLPTDDEQVGSAHTGILGEHVLKTLLGVQRRRHQLVRSIIAHSPNCHFDGHRPSFRSSPCCHWSATLRMAIIALQSTSLYLSISRMSSKSVSRCA